MRYCKVCVLPESRPNIVFDDCGNCNCATNQKKESINWQEREKSFFKLVETVKGLKRTWDCVIPVSGGKDSTWQVVKCLEYGLKPLCVTWRAPGRNEIGQRNLDNLINLGVDHFDVSISPKIEKKFTYKAFEKLGTPALPMHLALFAIPLNIAAKFDIPLVVWAENTAMEYGGDEQEMATGFQMDNAWLKKYGAIAGTEASDWVDEELSIQDLGLYFLPKDEVFKQKKISAIFLGFFFKWDPLHTFTVAREHGFRPLEEKPKTGYYKFADIDDDFLITIHHWLKWYKFGFTRLWDNLSLEIRNGRMTRNEALKIIKDTGDETPLLEIQKFCDWLGIAEADFFSISEKFRSNTIWENNDQFWKIRDFIFPDWNWNKSIISK